MTEVEPDTLMVLVEGAVGHALTVADGSVVKIASAVCEVARDLTTADRKAIARTIIGRDGTSDANRDQKTWRDTLVALQEAGKTTKGAT